MTQRSSPVRQALGLARSLIIYRRPFRQRALKRLYTGFVGPGDLVFDIGAHLGDRTMAFSALGARVVALEPQPRIFAWLKRSLGRRSGVTLRASAAGSAPGQARLAISAAHPSVSTLAEDWCSTIGQRNAGFAGVRWEHEVTVPVTTLDDLIREHGVPRFCKIDVEGHEAEVLRGLSQPLAALSVEFVDGALPVARACVARLGELGAYEFNVIGGEGRRFLWSHWRSPDDVVQWLDHGAGGLASGDLYARLSAAA
jgi:FkbM family methyltransferase